ncbi:MAG: polysaccharide deacetylase family protein [Bacilli bacterium]|nr:polysaccharide deacetylase family protein [Bacilli bacterium]
MSSKKKNNKNKNKRIKRIKRIKGQKIHSHKLKVYNNTKENTDSKDITSKTNINSKDTNSKHIIIPIIALIILLLFNFTIIPRISFEDNNVNIRYNTKYKGNDYKARNLLKDYTNKVKVINRVNTKKIGDYKVEYELKFGIIKIKRTRIVSVIDDVKPNINLKGDNPETVCPEKEYKEPGFEAIDEYDGNLDKDVKITSANDIITYTVKDESGNKKTVKRKIVYEDKEKPTIELKGNNNISIYTGNKYEEPGYTAIDNCDGDLTDKVSITGSVDTGKTGTYEITYKVKDNNNNEATATRKIEVKNWSIIRPSSGGNGKGIVYLTFDDGPNEGTTNAILDVLKEEGIQATFFITCNGPDYLVRRMNDEGHTIALHTATHNYNYVYSSVDNYFNDLNQVSNRVKSITGIESKIIRFPGGSSNTISKRISPGIMTTLTSEVKKRGYKYFDWNVDSNDAAGANAASVYSNVTNNISLGRENIVLMHDIKTATKDAIRKIIKYGKENGFTFKKITMDTVMITHGVNN